MSAAGESQFQVAGPTRIRLVATDYVYGGLTRITTYVDAAHWLACFRKAAEQCFFALVTDDKDTPLGIVHHSKGTSSQYVVTPGKLAGALPDIPGASQAWLGYNQPHGDPSQSESDHSLLADMSVLLSMLRIRCRGLIVVAPGGAASYWDGEQEVVFDIPAHPRRIPLPLLERRVFLNRRSKS